MQIPLITKIQNLTENKKQLLVIILFLILVFSFTLVIYINTQTKIQVRPKAAEVSSPQCMLDFDAIEEVVPTLTPILTAIPTQNPTSTPTLIPTRTPTQTIRPTNTPVVVPTAIPTRAQITPTTVPHCDSSCGACGWFENGVCTNKWGNNACCHMACVSGACKYVVGAGVWDCRSCP